ncbi:hypothetical protein ABIA06_003216 [Bradyrhizobium yuanmingense]
MRRRPRKTLIRLAHSFQHSRLSSVAATWGFAWMEAWERGARWRRRLGVGIMRHGDRILPITRWSDSTRFSKISTTGSSTKSPIPTNGWISHHPTPPCSVFFGSFRNTTDLLASRGSDDGASRPRARVHLSGRSSAAMPVDLPAEHFQQTPHSACRHPKAAGRSEGRVEGKLTVLGQFDCDSSCSRWRRISRASNDSIISTKSIIFHARSVTPAAMAGVILCVE